MTNLSINGIELLAVTVPEGAFGIEYTEVFNAYHDDPTIWYKDSRKPLPDNLVAICGDTHFEQHIMLPSGEYEPLGLIKDISEQVAATIVGERLDYTSIIEIYLPTFKESLSSLLKSKGLDSDCTYLLKKIA